MTVARIIIMASLLAPAAMLGQSKDANGKPCPSVTPKTSQEALMMEQASNKKGCWQRDQNGKLVFVISKSDTAPLPPSPKAAYKSLVGLVKIEWDGTKDCSAVGVRIFKSEEMDENNYLDSFSVGYQDPYKGRCDSYRQTGLQVPSGRYRVEIRYPGSSGKPGARPMWVKEVAVSAGETVTVMPPQQRV